MSKKRPLPEDSDVSSKLSKRSKSDASMTSVVSIESDSVTEKSRNGSNSRKSSSGNSNSSTSSCMDQNVRVVTRLRPLSAKERNENCVETIKALTKPPSIIVDKNRKFEFDSVFGSDTTQSQVYEKAVGDMVKSNIFKGFNVTILAYGQTGAGKTFTMGTQGFSDAGGARETDDDDLLPPASGDGIIPRAVYDLFQTRQKMKDGKNRIKVEMSYLEIYNEEARDLLSNSDSHSLLHIRDGKDGVTVQNLSWVEVKSPAQVGELMGSASEKRATASTQMNAVSSRSHAICTLNVTIVPVEADDGQANEDGNEECAEICAKLTLVDLAGSERIKRTGAEGSRMKEGININKGLFVLGQVVSALSELGQQQGQSCSSNSHVPYRDSKLTRLLQDSLGGNSRTIMVACVSPADSNVEESINTLRYAQRARNIKNSAVRNVVATSISPVEAAALRRENKMLQLKVLQLEAQLKSHSLVSLGTTNGSAAMAESSENQIVPDITDFNVEKLEVVKMLRAKCAWLQSKVEQAEDRIRSAVEDSLSASVRTDRWQLKVEELVAAAKGQGVHLACEVFPSESSNSLVEKLRQDVSNLKTQLQEALSDAAVARATAAAVIDGDGDLTHAEEIALAREEIENADGAESSNSSTGGIDLENEKLASELIQVSEALEKKEAMARQISKENECMEVMRTHFDSAIQSLQEEVDTLTSEREVLLEKLERANDASSNPQMRGRMKELEVRIKELTAKVAEHRKALKMRELAEKRCAQLTAEIQEDKRRRAALQRKLKAEADERRSEKKTAQKQAARMLRDSQKLKCELQKVKDAAVRQAAVLRRKAAEAVSRQKQLAEQQKKRNNAVSMRAMAKTSSRKRRLSHESDQRREELLAWLDREIESSMTLVQTKEQIEEQNFLVEEAMAKREKLSNCDLMENATARALDSEIENRTSIIKQLQNNLDGFQKTFDGNTENGGSKSHPFQDAKALNSFSRKEAKFVLAAAFDHVMDLNGELFSLREKQKEAIAQAVNKVAAEEKKNKDDMIMKLKMEHSEAMMTFLESTRSTIELELRANIHHSQEDSPGSIGQEEVDKILKTYLDSCTTVGEKLRKEFQDVKNHQEGVMKTMNELAKGIVAAGTKKKKTTKSVKTEEVDDDSYMFDIAIDGDDGEDSDDSDWNPDTPAKKKHKPDIPNEKGTSKPDEPAMQFPDEGSEEEKKEILGLDGLKVIDLRNMLRQRGLATSGRKTELVKRLRSSMATKDADSSSTNENQVVTDLEKPCKNTAKENHDKENVPVSNSDENIKQKSFLSNERCGVNCSSINLGQPESKNLSSTAEENLLLTLSAKKRRRNDMNLALNSAFSEFEKLKSMSVNVGTRMRPRNILQ